MGSLHMLVCMAPPYGGFGHSHGIYDAQIPSYSD